MKRILMLLCAFTIPTILMASGSNLEVRFINKKGAWYSDARQQQLRSSLPWQQFKLLYPKWSVQFNEQNARPHKAWGTPIPLKGNTLQEKALGFLSNQAAMFQVPVQSLKQSAFIQSQKFDYLHYKQYWNGLEVLYTQIIFKFTKTGELVSFNIDAHSNISIDLNPTINSNQATVMASAGVPQVSNTTTPTLKLLPVPVNYNYQYKLVWQTTVSAKNEQMPAEWQTLVDAHTGSIVERFNKVVNHKADEKPTGAKPENAPLTFKGTIYPKHQFAPSAQVNLPYLRTVINNVNYIADSAGQVTLPVTLPTQAEFQLRGPWSRVVTGVTGVNTQINPSFTLNLNDTTSIIDWDNQGTPPNFGSIRHLTTYYHVNQIHDSLVKWMPNNTTMNSSILTVIDRNDGSCNAFYTTSPHSVNFFETQGNCAALSQAADVIFHEYGHGITNQWYIQNGLTFDNGAMGEGYSDIFGIAITRDPVLGVGFSTTNPNSFIRRYDVNWKVYPKDLVGQVHADGEIICGAWWHTAQKIGDMSYTIRLICEGLNSLPNAANGDEGALYMDIFIDALLNDDDDNNLFNGTPNDDAIIEAFGMHGFVIMDNLNLIHAPVNVAPGNQPIVISADLQLSQPWDAFYKRAIAIYKINNSSNWDTVTFTQGLGSTINATIPAQPKGTIVSYFLALEDITGHFGNVQPVLANDPLIRNIPYQIKVGAGLIWTEDFDANRSAGYQTRRADDNASTGRWVIAQPLGSFDGNTGEMVQTNSDYSNNGTICAVTANAPFSGTPPTFADVDNGKTTLTTPAFNAVLYNEPILSYYRWFTNDQGMNPFSDPLIVQVSNDSINWFTVEQTYGAEHNWRNFAFRVRDYVTPNTTVYLRFVALDSASNGDCLYEVAVDDIEMWDGNFTGVQDLSLPEKVVLYPNPAQMNTNISFTLNKASVVGIKIADMQGKIVSIVQVPTQLMSGEHSATIPTQNLPNGTYQVLLSTNSGSLTKTLLVQH